MKILNINTKTNNHKCIILTKTVHTMLSLITINVCIYKYNCIKIVNISTKTNHTCIILTNQEHIQYIGTLFVTLSSSS